MKIGIVTNIGNNAFRDFLSIDNWEILNMYGSVIGAPAVETLIEGFLRQDHFIRIFTLSRESFILKEENLEIIAVKQTANYFVKHSIGCFVDAHRLGHVMKTYIEDLDVIHAHWTYANAYAASMYKSLKPVFCTIRDWAPIIWRFESKKNKVYWTFKIILNEIVLRKQGVHFIANSPYTQNLFYQKKNRDIPMIPNPIMKSFIKEDVHHTPNHPIILCISSSDDKRKNIISLLEGFKIFRSHHLDAELILVGHPFCDNNPHVIKWKHLGLLENVKMLGSQKHSELLSYYDNCSVFVTPSREETFGNTLIEAFARKVPVIGGENSGAVPYVLHHGECGYLCDVDSPISIYETIESVMNNPKEVSKKVTQAFAVINDEYLDDIICNKHISLYKQHVKTNK